MLKKILNSPTKITIIFLSILSFITLTIFLQNISNTDGTYIYPLDDSYIHLKIALNLVQNNVWGINTNEFCSTSSSPYYTIILAIFIKLFGNSSYHPLALNIIFGILSIVLIHFYFKNEPTKLIILYLFLLIPTFYYIQILSGMEHTLQILALLLVLFTFSKILNNPKSNGINLWEYLLSLTFLSLTRYESMFVFGGIILYLFFQNKYKLLLLTAFFSFLPILLFGWYSLNFGGDFFPNSLLLKSNIQLNDGVLYYLWNFIIRFVQIRNIPFLFTFYSLIFVFVLYIIKSYKKLLDLNNLKTIIVFKQIFLNLLEKPFLFITIFTCISHIILASFNWLYRYEAYLYILIIFTVLKEFDFIFDKVFIQNNKKVLITLLILVFLVQFVRFGKSTITIYYASKNIYEQQIQTTNFINKFYNNRNIIANDIGAITYFNNINLLDLAGLGSNNIFREIRSNKFFRKELLEVLEKPNYKKYNLMFIYEEWFPECNFKEKWIKVGQWGISDNHICGGNKVSIFVRDTSEYYKMKSNLLNFNLNKNVKLTVY